MFGFLKKLGRKSATAPALAPVAIAPDPVSVAVHQPAAPMGRPTMRPAASSVITSRTALPSSSVRAKLPIAALTPAAGENHSAVAVPSATPPPAVIVELSLKKLWTKLPPEVLQAASGHPNGDASLRLPLPMLQAQLAKGAVRMPFAQLRQYSPEGLFPANPAKDNLEVEIPVGEILPLLKPEHFARRPNQRIVAVPEDIGPIFGPNGGPGGGLRILEQKPRTPVRPAPTPPDSIPAAPFKRIEQPSAPASSAPVLEAPIAAPTLPPQREPAPSAPVAAITPAPEAASPAPMLQFSAPPELRNERIPAPKLDPSLASLRAVPARTAAAAVPATSAKAIEAKALEGNFTLPLMDVSAYWSEKGKTELANLYRHSLEIPMSTLESALKTGKLSFQWREVRPWLRLAPGNTVPSLSDDLMLDFPLAIIAPRFIEQRGQGKQKDHSGLIGDIPEVFEQKHPPQVNGSSGPMLGATAVPLENAADQAPAKNGDTAFLKRTAGKPLLEYGEIFGQPEKKNWTLAEVAQKTIGLRGVAGAIIGTSDGLLVAGSWPGAKSDAVAALMPQMFGRIVNFTKELQLGEPGNFTLMIDNTPLQVFKAGTSYFAVSGRPGENLPKAQLNAVAMRLGTTHK